MVFIDGTDYIYATGFGKTNNREYKILDIRKPEVPYYFNTTLLFFYVFYIWSQFFHSFYWSVKEDRFNRDGPSSLLPHYDPST